MTKQGEALCDRTHSSVWRVSLQAKFTNETIKGGVALIITLTMDLVGTLAVYTHRLAASLLSHVYTTRTSGWVYTGSVRSPFSYEQAD